MIWFKSAYIEAFGGMKDREFTFTPGLNLLVGDNGAGKSTLSAFLRFVLYGFTDKNDKKKWMPLNGDPAGGTLTLVSGEEIYRIERRAGGKTEDRAAILRSDGSETFVGRVPGEVFFGLPCDGFLRSAYIRQKGAEADSDRALALDNLLFAADENMNVGAALKKLDSARIELWHKNKKGGQITQLTGQRDSLLSALHTASSESAELIALEGTLTEGREKMTKSAEDAKRLDEQIAAHAVLQYEERKQELSRLSETAKNAQEALFSLEEKGLPCGYRPDYADRDTLRTLLSRKEQVTSSIRDGEHSLEEARKRKEGLPDYAQLVRDAGGEETLLAGVNGAKANGERMKKGSTALLLLSLLCAVAGLILLLLKLPVPGILLLVLAALSAAGSVFLRKKRREAAETLASLLASVSVGSEEELKTVLRALRDEGKSEEIRLTEKLEELTAEKDDLSRRLTNWAERTGTASGEEAAKAIEGHFEALRALRSEAEKSASAYQTAKKLFDSEPIPESSSLTLPEGFSIERAKQHCAFYRKQNEMLTAQIHEKELRLAELNARHSDPAELSERLADTEREIEEKKQRHDALVLAGEALMRASAQLRATVSPRLSRDAGDYLSVLTGGEYDWLGVDEDLELHCRIGSSTVSPAFLSEGVRADAYFALRLSLLRLLCPGRLPPLVLDETFVFLDPTRLRRAMELLRSLSEEQQIFLFSASGREVPDGGEGTVLYL